MKRLLAIFLSVILLAGLLAGCAPQSAGPNEAPQSPPVSEVPDKSYAGTYTGAAPGYHGELSVTVTLDEAGKILSVAVGEGHGETEKIGTIAIDKIPGDIVSSQSLAVDGVTGATVTGDAIAAATAEALRSAGLDPADYGYAAVEAISTAVEAFDASALPVKAPKTDSLTLTDVKGREVTLQLPISTYGVSTMDVIDFIIPLLGEDAFNMLVASGQDGGGGLQTYSRLYTPIAGSYMKHVGQISDHNAPFDLEMILATSPEVLIVNSAMSAHKYALEVEPQLTEAGIPIVLIDVPGQSVGTSVQDTLKLLGQIFGKEERAAEVADFIDGQYALLTEKNLSKRSDRPTVYYEKSGYSEIFGTTSTSKSGWGAVIAMAGGDNIADPILLDTAAAKGGGSTLDPEYVLSANPQFIVLSGSGAGWMDNFEGSKPEVPGFDILNRTGWGKLQAVKDGKVYELAHATSRSVFGFYAAVKLATVFYPEEYKDVDADAALEEFFQRFMLTDSSVTGWFFEAPGGR